MWDCPQGLMRELVGAGCRAIWEREAVAAGAAASPWFPMYADYLAFLLGRWPCVASFVVRSYSRPKVSG